MKWIRKERTEYPAPEPDPDDDIGIVRAKHADVTRLININSGRMPTESVVLALHICDVYREIIDAADDRPLDIYTATSIERALDDYLPTTLRAFVAAGPNAADSLRRQLESLLDAAYSAQADSRARGTDAMTAQGEFLRTKFARSDLDL